MNNLAKDLLYNDIKIHMNGNNELIIENYKGILLYTCEEICVACKAFQLRVIGEALNILYFSKYDMKISGKIHEIIFVGNE